MEFGGAATLRGQFTPPQVTAGRLVPLRYGLREAERQPRAGAPVSRSGPRSGQNYSTTHWAENRGVTVVCWRLQGGTLNDEVKNNQNVDENAEFVCFRPDLKV